MKPASAETINQLVQGAQKIVIIQADNPDADSLGSALALESSLGEMGKQVFLYCGVDIPSYLRYLSGWDRVEHDLPLPFDLSIVVDASTLTLLEKLLNSPQASIFKRQPCIVLDHHATVQNPIDFSAAQIIDEQQSSTGELIYRLAEQLKWPLPLASQQYILTAILGDTQGLSNQLARPDTYRLVAAILEAGVDRTQLEEARREQSKMPREIYGYKAQLIERTEFLADGRLAIIIIPQAEISEFSPLYNPAPLIQGDMLQTADVQVAIVLKSYDDGHVTGAIRCNPKAPIAARIAEQLGGGGHDYASGFKVARGQSAVQVKKRCLELCQELLATLDV